MQSKSAKLPAAEAQVDAGVLSRRTVNFVGGKRSVSSLARKTREFHRGQ
jgi:hypothetical protein